jgi:NAD(P)-dependent dehydrogenase (short-subunit alcohol dehydrogenase family)
MSSLKGKVAIITGAGSGIGRATVELFAKELCQVALVDISREKGEETLAQVKNAGGTAIFCLTNIASSMEVKAMVEATINAFGSIDIVVNCAAVGSFNKPLDETDEEEWDRVLAINLKGTYLVNKYAIPHIRARGSGSIVNFASVHSYANTPGVAAYAASKGGVLALTRSMAIDYAKDNIRVNCIVPGAVDTPMLRSHAASAGMTLEQLGFSFNPRDIGRIAQPIEIAKVALFLASEASSFATGAPFIVDGGLLAKL